LQRPPVRLERAAAIAKTPVSETGRGASPPKARLRLSYKEQRELAVLPEEIEALEREQTLLIERISAVDYYQTEGEQLRIDRRRLEELETLLLQKFARWEWLEERAPT
jgi:ABC transport system ATP-binding/permease protein